jgi:hypothetical protein
MTPGVFDGSLLGEAHPMLDLGEGLLDWIEIGGVRRQAPEPGTGRLDHLSDDGRLVRAEVVHDDDVAGLQHRYELLLDIGAEASAVDRSVKDTRRGELVAAQRAEEGQRAPMAVRGIAAQSLALRPPSAQRRHVGLDPGLVDEDQPLGVEPGLPGAPALPPARDVRTGLLKSEQGFF